MNDKRPQPTATLIKRLRRVAKWLDDNTAGEPDMAARANTCWQCAGRLQEFENARILTEAQGLPTFPIHKDV